MEQNKVVDAIKAVLGEDSNTLGNSSDTTNSYNITINGNVSITVQTHPASACSQAPAQQNPC